MLAQSYIAIAEFNGALRHLQAVCDVGATLVGPSGMIDLEATEHSELYITRTCSWWKQSAFDKFPEWYVNELVEVRRPVIADVIRA